MADTDIAKLTFQVDNSEGLRRIQEIDKTLKQAGKATTDFTSKIQALGKSLAAFKIFDTIAKGSNDLQQSARRLAVAISSSASEANEFTSSIKSWIYGIGQLNPALNSTAKTLRQLTSEFTMTRSQAAEAIGDIAARLNTSFDDTNLQKALSFLPTATQNWAAYLGRLDEAKQIQDAFIRALATGMTRGLTRFGIQIDTQSDSFKALAENIRLSTGYSEEYSKRLAVMQKLMEQTSKAEGAFAEQSGSLANQWESLKNNLKEIKDMVADMLGKSIEPIVRAINTILTPQIKTFAAIIASVMTKTFILTTLSKSISTLFGQISTNAYAFGANIEKSLKPVSVLKQELQLIEEKILRNELNMNKSILEKNEYDKLMQESYQRSNIIKADMKQAEIDTRESEKKVTKSATNASKSVIKFSNVLSGISSVALGVSTALSLIPANGNKTIEKLQNLSFKITSVAIAADTLVRVLEGIPKIAAWIKGVSAGIGASISFVVTGVISGIFVIEQHVHDLMKLLMKFGPLKKMLEGANWLTKWISGMSISEKIAEKIRGIWSDTAEEVENENEKAKAKAKKAVEIQKEALTAQINMLTEKAKTFFTSINDELQQLLSAANETRSSATTAIYAQSVEALQYRTMKTDALAMKIYREVR